jgi:uncharacterized protein YbjT (DUF2867 family)
MTSPVLVTGGTGRLGRSVVSLLVDAGHDVRVLARRQRDPLPEVTFLLGDLRRSQGIDSAVRGAGVIINCATSTKGDAEMTRNLMTAMTAWGYEKRKLEVERIVEDSGVPWTILRVTQFYSYCFENSRKLAKFPLVAPVPGGFRVQPVDSVEVAARLVELGLGAPVRVKSAKSFRASRSCSPVWLHALALRLWRWVDGHASLLTYPLGGSGSAVQDPQGHVEYAQEGGSSGGAGTQSLDIGSGGQVLEQAAQHLAGPAGDVHGLHHDAVADRA